MGTGVNADYQLREIFNYSKVGEREGEEER